MKILVVEDEECQLMWLTKKLSDRGHEVVSATDGDSGFSCWKIHRPELVITDFQFPGKKVRNGLELIAAIRAIDPLQNFVMQTGAANLTPPFAVPVLLKPYRLHAAA